jgi:hypothetical protein
MKLAELAPTLTPDQLATCEVKVRVNWKERTVQLAIVDGNNQLIAVKNLDTPVSAPATKTQAEFWQVHHNHWLD